MTGATVLPGGKLELDRFAGIDPTIPCKAAIPLLNQEAVTDLL